MGASSSDSNQTTSKDETIVRIAGADGTLADAKLISGENRLITDATVTVEQVFGQDPFADSWFKIDNAGVTNDTLRIQVAATSGDPTSPDDDVAAVDVTVTVTASEAGDEIALRDKVVQELNADSNFKASLKARAIKDNAIVHVGSIFRGEFWERSSSGDFDVTTTGSAAVTLGFNKLELRGKPTELTQSIDDPRQGILGFAGVVTLSPSAATDLFVEKAETSGGSSDMTVDGSSTAVEFTIDANGTKQKIIQFMTFAGVDSGIKYTQFMAINSKLTNGILVEFKSQDVSGSFELIKSTDDFEDSWAVIPSDFRLAVQSGADHINGTKNLTNSTIILDPTGTYSTDDFIKITIQDDLSTITELNLRAKGFLREV